MPVGRWEVVDFLVRFDEWVQREDPPDEWRIAALAWVQSLMTDPYRRAVATPEAGPGWWFAEVPDAGNERVAVVCHYHVDAVAPVVRCSTIATLSRPV